eukprot:gnl/TRDRNA2_/TRDRNA2_143340_c0_seq1.p1 gnl/TRDRNA2_/TRDRNA2_143340_c0~~gnl/TRDRNA2_/TRDRNA2_143340_c0_seq1.p1  ORF type:complete len:170 (+),score=33.58 gnl/TRDRNA2_/TRDRNA2_143340_c0_seq1:244-753(+)
MIRKRDGVEGSVTCLADLDKPDSKIVVKGGGAYDLWLKGNMKHPEILIREETLEASFQAFCRDESIDAIAGLRSQQNSDLEVYIKNGGTSEFVILDENFMSVQQAIGIRKALFDKNRSLQDGGGDPTSLDSQAAVEWLNGVIDECLRDNVVGGLIDKHQRTGKLFPAKV